MIGVLLLSTFTLTGCGSSFDEEAANKLEKDVYALYEEFKPIYKDSDTEYEISGYLNDWANDNGFVARQLGGGNLIITKPASVNDPAFPYSIIQCAISKSDSKQASQRAAIALATLLNLKENGKVSVLFTISGDAFSGAKRLAVENLDSNYFIHLESGEKSAINTGSASTTEYEMSLNLSTQKPTTTNAYQLSISGLSDDSSGIFSGSHPNSILLLSNFLIGCRASGLFVELADFDGGTEAGNFPGSANAIIMVNPNNEAKLLARFASSLESFKDKYSDDFADASYTLTPVTPPVNVISNDDTAKILSLLYTTINGVYKTSEENGDGTTLAVANIGLLNTTSKTIKINILARSVDEAVLTEMADSYNSMAYLSDASFRIVNQSSGWPFEDEQEFAQRFIAVAKDAGLDGLSMKPTFLQSECAIFYAKKKDINMISFSVNNNDSFLDAKALLFFLTSLVDTP